MKSTTRGTLAAVVTGVAAMVTAATPAAAASTVPVPVPLSGAEHALGMELPEAGGEIGVPVPGAPEGPRHARGRLLPERAVPRLPVHGALPGADLRAPVPHVLADDFDHVGLDSRAADLRTLAPGFTLDAPLTPPDPDGYGLPGAKLPQAGVLAPDLRTAPTAELGTGPGL
jgi:hypothetical protein